MLSGAEWEVRWDERIMSGLLSRSNVDDGSDYSKRWSQPKLRVSDFNSLIYDIPDMNNRHGPQPPTGCTHFRKCARSQSGDASNRTPACADGDLRVDPPWPTMPPRKPQPTPLEAARRFPQDRGEPFWNTNPPLLRPHPEKSPRRWGTVPRFSPDVPAGQGGRHTQSSFPLHKIGRTASCAAGRTAGS